MKVNLLNGEPTIEVDGVSFEVQSPRLSGKRVMVTETHGGLRIDVFSEAAIRASEDAGLGWPHADRSVSIADKLVRDARDS